jgi:hypothetical protein
LKQPRGTARTQIIAAEFFDQLFVAVDDAVAAFDGRFGREAFASLAHDLKSKVRFRISDGCAWQSPSPSKGGGCLGDFI